MVSNAEQLINELKKAYASKRGLEELLDQTNKLIDEGGNDNLIVTLPNIEGCIKGASQNIDELLAELGRVERQLKLF